MSKASVLRLTPKGLSVLFLISSIALTISSKVSVAAASIPRAPARQVAATRFGPATQPIPV